MNSWVIEGPVDEHTCAHCRSMIGQVITDLGCQPNCLNEEGCRCHAVQVGPEIDEAWLPLLIEECAEVIQAATKIMRFGVDDVRPNSRDGKPNSEALLQEIGDLMAVMQSMKVDIDVVSRARLAKLEKLKTYGPHGTYLKDKEAGVAQRDTD